MDGGLVQQAATLVHAVHTGQDDTHQLARQRDAVYWSHLQFTTKVT